MKAKKSLGQNFLKSEPALRKIIEAGDIKPSDIILEIGPGKGALTKKLLEHIYPHPASPYVGGGAKGGGGMVIAVEKDRELFEFLKEKFAKEIKKQKLILLNEDILYFDVKKTVLEFFSGPRFPGSLSQPDHSKNSKQFSFKIIANIPYNITGAILKKFLTAKNQPACMVLMVQHEVAKRIVARDGKESILSVSVKAYGEPKLIMKVPARYFSPAPKVDSAIIAIKNISRKHFTPLLNKEGVGSGNSRITTSPRWSSGHSSSTEEEKFWEIVKMGFAHKRKKLSGNLRSLIKNNNIHLIESLGNKRAEDLTLKDWIALVK